MAGLHADRDLLRTAAIRVPLPNGRTATESAGCLCKFARKCAEARAGVQMRTVLASVRLFTVADCPNCPPPQKIHILAKIVVATNI
jgi:hypothetical protein